MGTSYDVYCLDCDSEAGVSANWDPIRIDPIRGIIEVAPRFAGVDAHDVCDVELKVSGVAVPLEWLGIHGLHRLRPKSEYGEVDGTCAKDIKCKQCGSRLGYCELDVEHSGDHGKRKK